MKRVFIGIVACLMLVASSFGNDDTDPGAVLAVAYVKAVLGGDVKKANAMVALPYSKDRRTILNKLEDVEAFHKEVVEGQGKKPMPKHTVKKVDTFKPLKKDVYKKPYTVYRIEALDGEDKGETIDIYVLKTGKTCKVIGFSD